jgi:hypothetical protein
MLCGADRSRNRLLLPSDGLVESAHFSRRHRHGFAERGTAVRLKKPLGQPPRLAAVANAVVRRGG